MSNYIFLKENFSEGPDRYFAISKETIETLNVADTYDNYGQLIGHHDAEDYHIGNSESSATRDCLQVVTQKFDLNNSEEILIVEVDDDDFMVDDLYGENQQFNTEETKSEINAFIKEWRKENENLNACEGFTYWDGHNYKTITTSADFGETSHSLVKDDELTKELNEAIDNLSFEKEGFGCKIYTHEDWVIIDSQWQGTWAAYELMKADDYGDLEETSAALPKIF